MGDGGLVIDVPMAHKSRDVLDAGLVEHTEDITLSFREYGRRAPGVFQPYEALCLAIVRDISQRATTDKVPRITEHGFAHKVVAPIVTVRDLQSVARPVV